MPTNDFELTVPDLYLIFQMGTTSLRTDLSGFLPYLLVEFDAVVVELLHVYYRVIIRE